MLRGVEISIVFPSDPEDPDENDKQKRERGVTRMRYLQCIIGKLHMVNADPERAPKVLRYVGCGYDKFVHGAYTTAMELGLFSAYLWLSAPLTPVWLMALGL